MIVVIIWYYNSIAKINNLRYFYNSLLNLCSLPEEGRSLVRTPDPENSGEVANLKIEYVLYIHYTKQKR
jgi:hypothetical protein